jgi:hypothetical protein
LPKFRYAILFTTAAAAFAQRPATVSAGVPLRVALEHRVAIKHTGEPIEGRLADPVYVFDRKVLPAGSLVEGHVAEIGGVPLGRRLTALLSGNFTPAREVRAQFDSLVLRDGSRLSFRTLPSRGTAHTVRVGKKRQKHDGPGRISQLTTRLLGMLPYHRQAWSAGTLFNGVLQDPLLAPGLSVVESEPPSETLHARLLTSVSSAAVLRGAPVEAVVTQPQFSADHRLLIPEGSRLHGQIVKAQKARWFHRNGKLLFVFRQLEVPSAAPQSIQGYLEGVEADFDAHLALDSEGATRVRLPKTRLIFPALAVAAAGLSFHQDFNAQGVPDQDIGGRAESGAVGFGLAGTLLAQASRRLASSIAITGAGFSIYTTFIARGQEVFLPANTPITISFKSK